jgi:hypothetical protein
VISWLPYKDNGVTFVRFSDLKLDHPATLRRIEKSTSQTLKSTITQVQIEDKRYRPDYKSDCTKRGQIGLWKEYFSSEDLHLLDSVIFDDVKGISYDPIGPDLAAVGEGATVALPLLAS